MHWSRQVLRMTGTRSETHNVPMPTRPPSVHPLPPPGPQTPSLADSGAGAPPPSTSPADGLHAILLETLSGLEFDDVIEIRDGMGSSLEALFPRRGLRWTCRLNSRRFRGDGAEPRTLILPFGDDSTDLFVANGILMRVPPRLVRTLLGEMSRISRRYIVLLDWFRLPSSGVLGGPTWVHDYRTALGDAGMTLRNVILLEGGSQRLYVAEHNEIQATVEVGQAVAVQF